MKNYLRLLFLIATGCCFATFGSCQKKGQGLKVVIIRHGEKPADGDNLTCKGLNRALALPKVLNAKFGVASSVIVPAINAGNRTKSGRMFQTVTPYAVKYNLDINSSYEENDYKRIAKDVRKRSGVVIMVWEHNAIPGLARALGVDGGFLDWGGDDFDSIWVITYKKDVATLTKDKEGLNLSSDCSF